MKNKIIIITGYPASGKTTFGLELSKILDIPFFNLDSIKTAIGKVIEIDNWEKSKCFGKSSFFVLMHILENIMKVNNPLIIENSFIHDHEIAIKYLLEKYKYESLSYFFKCNSKILHKRFIKREYSLGRDNSNKVFGLWDEFHIFARDIKIFDDFNIGNKIEYIVTSNFSNVNFDKYINIAKDFFNKKDS